MVGWRWRGFAGSLAGGGARGAARRSVRWARRAPGAACGWGGGGLRWARRAVGAACGGCSVRWGARRAVGAVCGERGRSLHVFSSKDADGSHLSDRAPVQLCTPRRIYILHTHTPLLAGTCARLGLRLRGRLAPEAPSAATGVGAVSRSTLAAARASAYATLHGTAFPICV